MRYIISFFIVLLVVAIFILSFLLFKEKFNTEISLSTDDPNSDDFLQALGITDPSSQILISNSNGDLSLLPLSKLHAGINKVSQDGIVNNNTYYTTTADLPKTYTTTADLKQNYLQKGAYYSISNKMIGKDNTVHVDGSSKGADTQNRLIANDGTCAHDPRAYNFKFDNPCS